MSVDPIRAADTRAWLAKAREDLALADLSGTPADPITSGMVYHAQQGTEKVLKGFLAWHDRPFRKTHDLFELGRACRAIDPSLDAVIGPAEPLTEYAWRFRYPGEIESPPLEEAREALKIAHELFAAILALVPPEARP